MALRGIGPGSVSSVGGKAANLGRLIQAGLRVPDGFCITVAGYERFTA